MEVGVRDVWKPDWGGVVDDRAANCFVGSGKCFFLMSPGGAGESSEYVVALLTFFGCSLYVFSKGEEGVEVDAKKFWLFFKWEKGVVDDYWWFNVSFFCVRGE